LNDDTNGLEYLISLRCPNSSSFIEILHQLQDKDVIIIHASVDGVQCEVSWFPLTYAELEKCSKSIYKLGSEFDSDHPGYGDPHYKKRREYFTDIALNYKLGEVIPHVEYTEDEIKTWEAVYTHQKKFYPSHACREQNEGIALMEANCGYCSHSIPQLQRVSEFLKSYTGFQLCPVVGWIHSRDFLALLAFKVFPCTQYIRHHSHPFYTPEPDICHELLGHAPLFCSKEFADFSQIIGIASLGVSDEWIEKLSTLYWFTIEFGMVYENGSPKAYGAGLLSGCQELEYCVSDVPLRKQFDCSEAVVSSYPENGLQPLYFVADSISDVKNKIMDFAKKIHRPFDITFNSDNQSFSII
jgi:phenylalanine-4-hydroxylase